MGSGGPQSGFDIHNFFKTSSSSASAPAPPYSAGYNNTFPQASYPLPATTPAGTFPFPSQGFYSYMHPQEHMPRPPPAQPNPAPFLQNSFSQSPQAQASSSSSSPPLDGARLMALLTTQSSAGLRTKDESIPTLVSLPSNLELPPAAIDQSEASEAPPAINPAQPSAPPVPPSSMSLSNSSARSSKVPTGRHLSGEHVVYDIDSRLPGEVRPQLEVSPITVYSSDPLLVIGRQIAANRSYICYGLRPGTIRILNINTASRHLLRGHTQKVTDMAFVSDDVHTLASASTDGRLYVRAIEEGKGADGKNQIAEKPLVSLQFHGAWTSVQPRVCWWDFNLNILIAGIGKHVLTIDTSKNIQGSSEEPARCSATEPGVDGVHYIGSHENDVTGLCAYPGMDRFASSSKDGTVRIWGGQSPALISQLAVLAPHAGNPVNSVAFISAPRRPDYVVLLAADYLNKELKLYSPDGPVWKCIQTLELKSSVDEMPEDAFFNQLMVVPQASVLILANAKRNAIYVIHVEFGQQAQMDYLAEFSVRMPILSITATSNNVLDGEGTIQLYCIQTQAIQQYSLDLALCLPQGKQDGLVPPDTYSSTFTAHSSTTGSPVSKAAITGSLVSSVSTTLDSVAVSTPQTRKSESPSHVPKDVLRREPSADTEQLDKTGFPNTSSSVEARLESAPPTGSSEISSEIKEEKDTVKQQPRLITPSDLMSLVTRGNILEGETESTIVPENLEEEQTTLKRTVSENTEVLLDTLEGGNTGDGETLIEEVAPVDDVDLADERNRTAEVPVDDIVEQMKEVSSKPADFPAAVSQTQAAAKGKKNKNKTSSVQTPGASSSASLPEAESLQSAVPAEGLNTQLQAMQDTMMNQMINMQKDFQKQMAATISKETKRVEISLGQKLEKLMKANFDAVTARIMEENAKREKADRERLQQLTATFLSSVNTVKDVPATVKETLTVLERSFKKELAGFSPAVLKLIEKAVVSSLADAVQTVSDKSLPQIEKAASTKLETSLARQLQSQFQTTGRQALQDAMRSCFEGLVVPSFERSCRAMFEQVDAAFQKGMVEHTSHAQQQASASHTALASALQDTVATVTSLAVTMKSDLADGQRKLIALAENTGSRYPYPPKSTTGLPDKVLSLQHVEESLDPTIELTRLVNQGKLEDAFTKALSLSDVSVVSWLCNQVDPGVVFATTPPKLSQGVLLSLVQQLGCDLGKDTERKLEWIKGASLALNPNDPVLAPHMRPFLDQLYQNLHRQVPLASSQQEMNELRLVVHVVHSLLSTCK